VCDTTLVVMVQEGGYSIHHVAICGATSIAVLAGEEPMADPYPGLVANMYGRREVEDHQAAICELASELVPDIPGR